jgi:hypothetical protein
MARKIIATDGAVVVPSDTANMAQPAPLYIGVGGTVILETEDGTELTFLNIPDGSTLPISAKRVNATGTTATDIIALF